MRACKRAHCILAYRRQLLLLIVQRTYYTLFYTRIYVHIGRGTYADECFRATKRRKREDGKRYRSYTWLIIGRRESSTIKYYTARHSISMDRGGENSSHCSITRKSTPSKACAYIIFKNQRINTLLIIDPFIGIKRIFLFLSVIFFHLDIIGSTRNL